MTSIEESDRPLGELIIAARSGMLQEFSLAEGTTLIVGQGQNCGLRLDGEGVSAMHCVLRLL